MCVFETEGKREGKGVCVCVCVCVFKREANSIPVFSGERGGWNFKPLYI